MPILWHERSTLIAAPYDRPVLSQHFNIVPFNVRHQSVDIIEAALRLRMIPVEFFKLVLDVWVVFPNPAVARINLIDRVLNVIRAESETFDFIER